MDSIIGNEDLLFELIRNVSTIKEVQTFYNISRALRKFILRKDVLVYLVGALNLNGDVETIEELTYLATHCYIHELDNSVIKKYREEKSSFIFICERTGVYRYTSDLFLDHIHRSHKNIKRGDIVFVGKDFGGHPIVYIFNGMKLLLCEDRIIPSEFGLITEFGCSFWKSYEEQCPTSYPLRFDISPFYKQMMNNFSFIRVGQRRTITYTTFTHNDLEYTLMCSVASQSYGMAKQTVENSYRRKKSLRVSSCSQSLEEGDRILFCK